MIAKRTGSYPFKYIAEDFDVPYDIVLSFADDSYRVMYETGKGPSIWGQWAYTFLRQTLHESKLFSFQARILTANSALYRARTGRQGG